MKDSFEKLVSNLKKSREKCPWSRDREIKEHLEELKSEVDEAISAVDNRDYENLKEELGDTIMDAAFIGVIAEEKNLFTIKEILEEVNEKVVRRKPWVFAGETVASKEEAVRRWNEIKKDEKEMKNGR